jgi:hypothetical protein
MMILYKSSAQCCLPSLNLKICIFYREVTPVGVEQIIAAQVKEMEMKMTF